jgi:hypothetical protein
VTPAGKFRFGEDEDHLETLLCEGNALERAICPVVRGQVVGLSFDDMESFMATDPQTGIVVQPDIAWKINNTPLVCSTRVSSGNGCDPSQPALFGSENFFPVTGKVGDTYAVTVTINNPVSGKSLSLNRMFRVVEPSVTIASVNDTLVWRRYLGQFINVEDKRIDDYSRDMFEAFPKTYRLSGQFFPQSLRSRVTATWLVGGKPVAPDKDGFVTIDASNKAVGSIDDIVLRGQFTPNPKVRKAMHDIWGVAIVAIAEIDMKHDIQVQIVPNESDDGATTAMGRSKKFFASLIAYVPTSVIFFFRLIVSMAMILIAIGVAFSFVPEKRRSTESV